MQIKQKTLKSFLAASFCLGLFLAVVPTAMSHLSSEELLLCHPCSDKCDDDTSDECPLNDAVLYPTGSYSSMSSFTVPPPVQWKCWFGCPLP
ncbi:hypothetical protein CH54_2474 [Yersinia rochesterensis]|uniref:Secreted protein n=1 Tax=Yersinia rochesterensis TaxID=1604335 RepID=A0ABN4FIA1_9GAMM|nr:hypothetical protein DJ57_3337 [Yersinia rochesterensis]AJI87543.1 hypothetical protein AW19_3316 [Yersinia frederiksenii Y225]AJJ37104.1 hypothetical protein CH54_2474 [Yersinia rochesterensis]CNH63094.1 Uncharacterised protein [Yersinia kristensenii]CRY62001.1 Uncharacterised protein [Yersinia kristensenii]